MKIIDVGLNLDNITEGGSTTTNSISVGSLTADGNISFDLVTGANSLTLLDTAANLMFEGKGELDNDTFFIGLGDMDNFDGGAKIIIRGNASEVEVDKQLVLSDYGSGTYTGTVEKYLAIDGDGFVIESDVPTANLDGSGTTSFIPKWVDTDTLTDSVIYEDSSKIGIGTGAVTPSEALEVVGNVEAEEFIGDLRGSVLFKAKAQETISKGDAVYISGIINDTTLVGKADANVGARMPAFGVAAESSTFGNPIDVYTFGALTGLDTSTPGFSIGDELYISTTSGVLSNTPPVAETSQIQKIGKVTRVHASQGSIFIAGAGRSNAVPNLNTGKLFVGDSNFQTVADDTIYVDIANSRVGINTTPGHTLEVVGSGVTDATSTLSIQNSTNDDILRVKDDGKLLFGNYGAGSFTGTTAKYLAVDANGNVIEEDDSSTPSEGFHAYNLNADQSIATSDTTLILDTEGFNSDNSLFSLSGNVLTVNSDIRGCITIFAAFKTPSATRSSVKVQLQVSTNGGSVWDDVEGAKTFVYVRQGTSNDDNTAGSATVIRETTSGDKYRVIGESSAGTVDTVAQSTGLTVYDLKGGERGPQGNSGGIDGTGGTGFIPKWVDSDTLTNSIIFEDATNTRIGVNQATPDSTIHVKGTSNDGNTNVFKFTNLDDFDRFYMNGGGRLFLETDNGVMLNMSRPGGQSILNFQNNGNEGAIGYAGNSDIRFSTGIVQRTSADFDFAIGQGTGTFDASTKALTVKQGQQIQFNSYGVGGYDSTSIYNLGVDVDGNVVERKEIRGTYSGTTNGTTGQLTFSHELGVVPTIVMLTSDGYTNQTFGTTAPDAHSVVSKTSTQITIVSNNRNQTVSGYYVVSL